MRRRPFRFNYNEDEVRVLIEDYEELDALRATRSFILVRLMDIDRALKVLPPKEREALLLCGQIGLTMRTAGAILGVSAQTMSNRYNHGLGNMARFLNGGL